MCFETASLDLMPFPETRTRTADLDYRLSGCLYESTFGRVRFSRLRSAVPFPALPGNVPVARIRRIERSRACRFLGNLNSNFAFRVRGSGARITRNSEISMCSIGIICRRWRLQLRVVGLGLCADFQSELLFFQGLLNGALIDSIPTLFPLKF